LRIAKVLRCRREAIFRGGIPIEKLFPIDDLKSAGATRAVAKINPIPQANGAMQCLWHGFAFRPWLLPNQTEVTDVARFRGIAEIVNLHPPAAPTFVFSVGHKVSNAGIALPPVFMCGRET